MQTTPSHSASSQKTVPSQLSYQNLKAWYHSRRTQHPWRVLWNLYKNPYHVWVSEVMLQQTTLAAVIKKYDSFITAFPTLESLAIADERDIRPLVRGLGYYRRFANLQKAAKLLSTCKQWPTTKNEWLDLPGIGPYTSAAISSICFQEPEAVVDGNVERIYCRQTLSTLPKGPLLKKSAQIWANQILDHKDPGTHNQAIMELGQTICRPKNPLCQICPVSISCLAYSSNTPELLPLSPLKKIIEIELGLFIYFKHNQIALTIRPDQATFLKKKMGFCTYKKASNVWQGDGHSFLISNPSSLGSFIHHITKYKITTQVFASQVSDQDPPEMDLTWVAVKDVKDYLVTSFDEKAFRIFEKTRLN